MDFDKFGGRKFILALLILLITTTIVLVKGTLDTSFAALMVGILGTFGASNVAAKHVMANAQGSETEEGSEAPSTDETAAALSQRIVAVENAVVQMNRVQQALINAAASK